ncbi:hypothetical protein [Streptomyces decoyicus]
MGMLLKPLDDTQVDIHDETGRIGEIFYVGPCDDTCDCGECGDFKAGWRVTLGPFIATVGPRTIGPYATLPEAVEKAGALYEALLVDRRYQRGVDRARPRTVSIPRGGQPR